MSTVIHLFCCICVIYFRQVRIFCVPSTSDIEETELQQRSGLLPVTQALLNFSNYIFCNKKLGLGPSSQRCLYYQDFQGSKFLSGYCP